MKTLKTETKRWSHLGLGAALAGATLLTACGQDKKAETPAVEAASPPAASSDEVQAETDAVTTLATSEGGEGEGGVATDRAGTDPVVFRSALAITEAHIIAARDAYIAGETQAAGEMFAHPVSEVLFDVGPYLEQQGVENFDQMLIDASGAVFEGETVDQISTRTDAIITTLRAAAQKAPDDGSSEARIQAGVAADQIDRAATMYGIAGTSDDYEPYLDGYGFYHAAMAAYELRKDEIKSELPDAAAAIETAFGQLAIAYPGVERPETLPGNPAALTATASAVILSLSE